MKRKHNITDEQAVEYWNALIDFCAGHTACIGCPLTKQCMHNGFAIRNTGTCLPDCWERAEVKKDDNN